MGLAALQFPTVRDFIVAAQSLEVVAAAGRRESDGLWEQKSVKSLHRLQGDLLFQKKEKEDILVSLEKREEILDQGVHRVDLCRAHTEGGHAHKLAYQEELQRAPG